jgi:hypothetical protein
MSTAEDSAEWLVTIHNNALAEGEDHGRLLDRVDGWVRGHLVRFRDDPTTVAYERKLLALTFEEHRLGTDLSHKMLRVIRGTTTTARAAT